MEEESHLYARTHARTLLPAPVLRDLETNPFSVPWAYTEELHDWKWPSHGSQAFQTLGLGWFSGA